jgi:hypothetical protein
MARKLLSKTKAPSAGAKKDTIGVWFNTPQVSSPEILEGTNSILVFQPKYIPGQTFGLESKVTSWKSQNPETEVFATIGDGDSGLTKSMVQTLIDSTFQDNLDGLVLELEVLGSGSNRGNWASDEEVVSDLKKLVASFKTKNKKIVITTGGSGLTAEMGCSLPSYNGGKCVAPLPDTTALTNFLTNLAAMDWDLWTPQIYDLHMKESWASWQKPGFECWKGFNSEKIVPSVGQGVGATVASMQGDLKSWLEASGLRADFPSIDDKSIIGYPYTTG